MRRDRAELGLDDAHGDDAAVLGALPPIRRDVVLQYLRAYFAELPLGRRRAEDGVGPEARSSARPRRPARPRGGAVRMSST